MLICRSIVKVIIFPDGMIAFLACDLYFPAITIVVVICKPVRNRNNIRILIVDIFTTFILHLFYRPLVFHLDVKGILPQLFFYSIRIGM